MPSVMEILIKAKDEASAVLGNVGAAGEESGGKLEAAWNVAGVAMVAAGAAIEGLARAQEDTTFAVDRLSIRSGVNADTIRAWGLEISGANDNILEMTQLMDLANRRGLEGKDSLQKYALFWDTISDATGESSTELAKSGVALAAVGVEAGNEGDAMAALGYISNNTTSSISDFLGFVGRTGPKLREMKMDVNDSAAVLGILQNELGMTGRTAIGQFNTAVNASDGDMNKLLATLGISAAMLDTYRGKVADSADILDKQAAAFDNTRTPVEHLTMLFGNLTSQYGGVIQQAAQLAPLLLAAGPIMWGLTAATSGLSAAKLFLAGTAIPAVSAAFLFLAANPIILVIAGIGLAVVALAFAFQNNFLGIRDIVQSVGSAIGAAIGMIVGVIQAAVGVIVGAFRIWVDGVKAYIGVIVSVLQAAGRVVQAAFGAIGAAVGAAQTAIRTAFDLIVSVVKTAVDLVKTYIGIWTRAFEILRDTVAAVIGAIVGIVRAGVGVVAGVIAQLTSIFEANRDAILGIIGIITIPIRLFFGLLGALIGVVQAAFAAGLVAIQAVIGVIVGVLQEAAAVIGSIVSAVVGVLAAAFQLWVSVVTTYIGIVVGILQAAVGVIVGAFQAAVGIIQAAFQLWVDIIKAAIGIVVSVLQAGAGVIVAIFRALAQPVGVAVGAVVSVFGAMGSGIGTAIGVLGQLLNGLVGTVQTIAGTIGAAFGTMGRAVGAVWDGISTGIRGAINGVIGMINRFVGFMNGLRITVPSVDIPYVGRVGGFSVGMPTIPRIPPLAGGAWDLITDTLAQLHAGEMVVPERPAGMIRQAVAGGLGVGGGYGGGFSGPLVYINNYSGGEKEDERLGRILQRRTR